MFKKYIILILSAATVMLSACNGSTAKIVSFDVYTLDASATNISRGIVEKKVETGNIDKTMLETVIERNIWIFPPDFKLLSYDYTEETLTINCSENILEMDEDELIAFSELCALTLNSLGDITKVVLKSNGVVFPWAWEYGYELRLFKYADTQNIPIAFLKLYFSDKAGEFLHSEYHVVHRTNNNGAYLVISELVNGAYNKTDLIDLLVPESIKTIKTENNLCTVDLSDLFVESIEGTAAQQMALYSIVNSLTEMNGIMSVMFSLNGKSNVDLGNYNLNTEFKRNDALVK